MQIIKYVVWMEGMKIGAGADQWLALGRDALQRPHNEAGAGCNARLAELRLDKFGKEVELLSHWRA